MASAAVITAVEARLAANWTRTPITAVSRKGNAPADGSNFLTVQYIDTRERQFTFGDPGNNAWKEEGTIRLVLESKAGLGIHEAMTWTDELAALFRGKYLSGVQCFEAVTPPFDGNSSGNYTELAVRVRYTFFRNG